MKVTSERFIPPVDELWPDPAQGPWRLQIEIDFIDGRPEPVSLSLLPAPQAEPHPLRTSLLRRVRVAEITHDHVELQRELLAAHLESMQQASLDDPEAAEAFDGPVADLADEVADLADSRRRPGRPVEINDRHYRDIAQRYRSAVAQGQPILKTLAKDLHIAETTVAKRVSIARKRGYLPPTTRGKARAIAEENE